jgi:hypothetical protein
LRQATSCTLLSPFGVELFGHTQAIDQVMTHCLYRFNMVHEPLGLKSADSTF